VILAVMVVVMVVVRIRQVAAVRARREMWRAGGVEAHGDLLERGEDGAVGARAMGVA
jgi:hypothetical protein